MYLTGRTPMPAFGLEQSVAPTQEPVSIADVRSWGDVATTFEDSVIALAIASCRAKAELYTGRQFVTATWKMYLDYFPEIIYIPHLPISSITSMVYTATDGTATTMSSTTEYGTDLIQGRIFPAWGTCWPIPRDVPKAITVTYVAGYGAASAVPAELKTAILIMTVDHLVNRGGVFKTPPGAKEILDAFWTGNYGR